MMERAEQLKPNSIRELMETPGPCVTIVLAGNEAGDTATELKTALQSIRRQLQDRNETDVDALLAPVVEAGRDTRGETKARGSIVILRSPSMLRVFRVSGNVKPLARANDRFDVRTLLSIAGARKLFYILALSQNRVRILKCTEDSSEEIPFPPGTPVSLADAMQTRQPDHVLENRQGGIPSVGSMGGVISGTSTDREAKDEYLLHFFRNIDKAVNECLKNNAPLIPVGVEHELALYRRVNTYPALIEPGVHGAPDGLEGGELQSRAMALLAERSRHFGNAVPADFDKRVGLGRASIRIPEIVSAAWEGRVSQLFFQEDAHYIGAFDPVRRRVKHTDDPLDSPVDLIESAAYQTVLHGGEARILPASAMPNGVAACAVFRYAPVAEKPGEMVGTAV